MIGSLAVGTKAHNPFHDIAKLLMPASLEIFHYSKHEPCQNIDSIEPGFNRVQTFPIKDSINFADIPVISLHFVQWAD